LALTSTWTEDAFVHRRKKRYMAQTLDLFEEIVEPLVPEHAADKFKGIVRRKFHALALDANEVHGLAPGEELNLEAIASGTSFTQRADHRRPEELRPDEHSRRPHRPRRRPQHHRPPPDGWSHRPDANRDHPRDRQRPRGVDKVPGEPDFTFTAESWDVTADIWPSSRAGSATRPRTSLRATSTRRAPSTAGRTASSSTSRRRGRTTPAAQGGHIGAGLILPGYYPTRMTCATASPRTRPSRSTSRAARSTTARRRRSRSIAVGDGTIVAFVTAESARAFRIGGAGGATFQRVFGVLLNGVLQVPGVDYVESVPGGTLAGASALTTITFTTPRPFRRPDQARLLHGDGEGMAAGAQRGQPRQAGSGARARHRGLRRHARHRSGAPARHPVVRVDGVD
jgi:hypothetical protein